MFARVHTLETTPEQHDEGLRIVTEELMPWLRDSTGFRGLIRLADPESGRVLTVTLWATEANMRDSAAAAEQLAALTTAGAGATRVGMDQYEVSFFDVQL